MVVISVIAAAKKSAEANAPSELGMHYFMRLVSDETKAAKPIVRISSLADDGSTQELPLKSSPTVFVIPGVEGCISNGIGKRNYGTNFISMILLFQVLQTLWNRWV